MGSSTDMIKNILSSKVTSTASAQFVVFGLKMVDSNALRVAGIVLCALSLTVLFYGWHYANKSETAVAKRRTRKSTQSRASRSR